MSWDELHSDDEDTTEYFDATPKPVSKPKEIIPEDISDEEDTSYHSPTANKGLRDREGIHIEGQFDDEPGKWDKYKI